MKTFQKQGLLWLFMMLFSGTVINAQNVTITQLNPVCNNDGILVATSSGNFIWAYEWYTTEGLVIHMNSGPTDTLYNFKGGFVNVHAASSIGTAGEYGQGYFSFPFNVVATFQPDTCPLQTGEVALVVTGGTGVFTYSWTFNGAPYGGNTSTISNLSGGLYDCLITDGSGCQMYLSDLTQDSSGVASVNVYSVNNISISLSTTPANCLNGTATVTPSGGLAPYTYIWSNGQTTQVATGLPAWSTNWVKVSDANGCFKSPTVYISSTVTITVNKSITPAHCTFSDGAVTTIPTGGTAPYAYIWNTLATTPSITNVTGGNYVVTVSDMQGCLKTEYIYIPSLTPVNVTFTTTPSQCLGATGSGTLNVSGGITPYTYEWFTTPLQNTVTATNLAPGGYNFKVTDSQGCTQSGLVTIPQNTTLAMNVNTTPSVCILNNGTADMLVSGGAVPYNYLWSNSQTTASISNLPPAMIFGTVTDALGCCVTQCKLVEYDSPLNFNLVPQWASCKYTADGSIGVNIINGTGPYTYQWSGGLTTSSISGLLPGIYGLYLTDANGCTHYEQVHLGYNSINPCTATIIGKVFIDLNGNCIADGGEPGLKNIPIHCSSINEYALTDWNGNYSFDVPVGVTTIEQQQLPYRYQVCPSTNPFTVNVPSTGITIIQDIADTIDYVNDLTIGIWNWSSPPIVGSTFVQRTVEFNAGTQAISSTAQYDYDSQAPFSNATLSPSTLNAGISRATWDNPFAEPLDNRGYNISHFIPASVPINTPLFFTDSIFPINGDTTWWDNSVFRIIPTVGSYDPNYKEVTPIGTGPQGYISLADSVLEFVIHFQNIGNYYAQNIKILDMLDSDLDLSTFRLVYSTHNNTTRIYSNGELEFNFENIYLPSIEQDTLLSNGFIVYKIHLKQNLPNGTQITNNADIYFDFNAPVTTNTTLNTILITGIEEVDALATITAFPNPNTGNFNIAFQVNGSDEVEINLFNTTGQLVYTRIANVSGDQILEIQPGELPAGVFILEVKGFEKTEHIRMVMQ